MKRTCKQCGAEFTLSQEEIAFYQSKNLHLPKRCENCRRENKAKAGGEAAQQIVRPYHEKRSGRIKWWMVPAAACVLLAVGIGAFHGGKLSERVRPDAANEPALETEAEVSAAEGMQVAPPADTQPETIEEPEDVPADTPQTTPEDTQSSRTASPAYQYSFRKAAYLQEHFEKHGTEFGYATADEYLAGANRVVASPEALHKLEAEDGDDVYYLESTNEFVIVSTDGYLRTYFKPDDGKAYFDRQ